MIEMIKYRGLSYRKIYTCLIVVRFIVAALGTVVMLHVLYMGVNRPVEGWYIGEI